MASKSLPHFAPRFLFPTSAVLPELSPIEYRGWFSAPMAYEGRQTKAARQVFFADFKLFCLLRNWTVQSCLAGEKHIGTIVGLKADIWIVMLQYRRGRLLVVNKAQNPGHLSTNNKTIHCYCKKTVDVLSYRLWKWAVLNPDNSVSKKISVYIFRVECIWRKSNFSPWKTWSYCPRFPLAWYLFRHSVDLSPAWFLIKAV